MLDVLQMSISLLTQDRKSEIPLYWSLGGSFDSFLIDVFHTRFKQTHSENGCSAFESSFAVCRLGRNLKPCFETLSLKTSWIKRQVVYCQASVIEALKLYSNYFLLALRSKYFQ